MTRSILRARDAGGVYRDPIGKSQGKLFLLHEGYRTFCIITATMYNFFSRKMQLIK